MDNNLLNLKRHAISFILHSLALGLLALCVWEVITI